MIYNKANVHTCHAGEAAFTKSKQFPLQPLQFTNSQISKLERLQSKLKHKDKNNNEPDLSGTLLTRWVKVLSNTNTNLWQLTFWSWGRD